MGKSRKSQKLLWAAAGVAVCASAVYWAFGPEQPSGPVLETAPVEFGAVTLELPATGSIDAVNVVDVGCVISGRIATIHADFNQRVKAGQLLATIDDSTYRAAYLQAEADLAAARAGIQVAAANLQLARDEQARALAAAQGAHTLYEQARLDLERNQKLLKAGIVTQAVLDRLQAAYAAARSDAASADAATEQARAKMMSAQAALDQARALADQRAARASLAKTNLDYCRITSPVDGVIVSRNVDVGQTVAARLQAPSLFHIAQDLTEMYVYTKLDSSDVAKVRPGLPAGFTVNAFPGETFEGKLIEVRINPNPQDPISRAATAANQFRRAITAGVTLGSTEGSQLTAASAASGGAAGSSSTGASGASSASSSPPPATVLNTAVVYDALIEFRNPDQKLLPGMTAYVTIPLGSVKDTLKVPNSTLRFSPDIPAGEKQRLLASVHPPTGAAVVWVVEGARKYRPVAVKPVFTDFVYTAVQSDELKPGMRLGAGFSEPKNHSSGLRPACVGAAPASSS